MSDASGSSSLRGLPAFWATIFGGAGVLHFALPKFFDTMVPEDLPGGQRAWTLGSGVVELGLSAAILHPTTRPKMGKPAALFLLGVLPGNVKMALDWQENEKMSPILKAGAWGRVLMQLPMIASVNKIR
ncbi:MAG TPA: hypothetical protein H9870_02555 [Candidatus Corynebacterium avicola]|uniref:DoxX family protein n=1 Tax=Candidatus Corynebacterium avicola TaxID=2838527 RepID=A0A9D1RM99_9CORY|nr:hypothetical protein [Candidatus Corynebacterium avicola]